MSNTLDIEDCGLGLSFDPQEVTSIRSGLLEWYDKHQRSLPWRKSTKSAQEENDGNGCVVPGSPYAVWVSEVMLQQTRVATVVDYFNRWMERWPTVHDLARATPEEVNEAWAGLGYYRRAALLHKGAKEVVEKHAVYVRAYFFSKTALKLYFSAKSTFFYFKVLNFYFLLT